MSSLGYLICVPFAWLVRFFYNFTGSYGVALILFTLVIKLLMLPFQMKSKRSMMRMSRMSGRMQELQKRYANNQAKLNEEMQKLYAEEGVNPMGGCLWTFLPFPILIALYSIIRQPITHFMMISAETMEKMISAVTAAGVDMSTIVQVSKKTGEIVMKDGLTQLQPYGQIELVRIINAEMPEVVNGVENWINVNYNFLGLDLTVNPTVGFTDFTFGWASIGLILIPILSGALSWLLSKLSMASNPQASAGGAAAASTKSMMIMMPLMSVYIGFIMPAALGVYWIAQSVFSIVQEALMNKFFNKKMEEEENAREAAIQADRARRMEEGRKAQEERKQQASQQKQTLREKQKAAQAAKAKKAEKAKSSTTEAGRVGDRPYARGRSFKEDRYDEK